MRLRGRESARLAGQRRSLLRCESGQAAVEFFLILPIFIVFFMMVVDLGILMYGYVSVANAVREGARYGATNCGDGSCTVDEIRSRVVGRTGNLTIASGEVTVLWMDTSGGGGNHDRGDSVVVRVNHPHGFVVFPWFAGTVPIVSCSVMRLEQADAGTGPFNSGTC